MLPPPLPLQPNPFWCDQDCKPQYLPFSDCCSQYLDDFDNHPTLDAESLMRSRTALSCWSGPITCSPPGMPPRARQRWTLCPARSGWGWTCVRTKRWTPAMPKSSLSPAAARAAAPRACTSAAALCASRGADITSIATSFNAKYASSAGPACARSYQKVSKSGNDEIWLRNVLLTKPPNVVVDPALNHLQGVLRDLAGKHALGHGRKRAGHVANLVNECTGLTG